MSWRRPFPFPRLASVLGVALQSPGVEKNVFSFGRFRKLHRNLCACVCALRPVSALVICSRPESDQPPAAPPLSLKQLDPS